MKNTTRGSNSSVIYTLGMLADMVSGVVLGNRDWEVDHVQVLDRADSHSLSFIHQDRYRPLLKTTQAGAVLLEKSFVQDCPVNAIIVDNPYLSLAKLTSLLSKDKAHTDCIHPTAIVGDNCQIGAHVTIGAYSVIGENVVIEDHVKIADHVSIADDCCIGSDTILHAKVCLYRKTKLGKGVIIHSGSVIGSDGFGNALDRHGVWHKMPQLGRVLIGDTVEIGANTTIDCGSFGDTVLGDGVKIDNQVQIAHNVEIGAHTAIAGCVGIAGSAKIGSYCMIGGGSGIVGHLTIADHTVITGMSMITKSIKTGGYYSSGIGFLETSRWRKLVVRLRQLDSLFKRVKKLEKQE